MKRTSPRPSRPKRGATKVATRKATRGRRVVSASAAIEQELPVAPGPRKASLPKKARREFSHHKARSVWFGQRAAWPLREAPVHKLVSERQRVERTLAPLAAPPQWECVGPTNIGGRITSLVCHPTQPDQIWAGAAGGGVWRSDDAGRSWQALWHNEQVLNIGALALHPANPKIIFCGTGEANLSADSYAGVGMYWSTDAGKTWSLRAASASTGIPTRIGVIAIDPHNPDHMRIGGIGYGRVAPDEAGLGGMYFSVDGGRSWSREVFISEQNYWCHAIVFHPTQAGVIFAAFSARGAKNGIYRSTDSGATWSQLKNGVATGRPVRSYCARHRAVRSCRSLRAGREK